MLDDVTVYRLAGHTSTFAEVIPETWTDAVVVLTTVRSCSSSISTE